MPKILRVRAAHDEKEEKQVRKLAGSRHGPADWILHARMVARSWDGERVETIAETLHCNPQTVRRRLHRFDSEGLEGLGDRSKPGRPRRLTAADDSKLIALVRQAPPGRLITQADGTLEARDEEAEAQWSLNALAIAAKEAGIAVKRSQIRTILLREGVRWRHTHSWGTPRDKDACPKRTAVVSVPRPLHRATRRVDDRLYRRTRPRSAAHVSPRCRLVAQRSPHPARRWIMSVGPRRPGSTEPYEYAMARN